ncbi:hypothetical protein NSQ20_05315 [Paenibacillus sp. FSL K6-1122]|uniref:hypothetical protein n=1 Tax=Paenibacillus sp. FSL K6-1122 TaxID=2954512 RepID=UPI0030EC543C
MSRIKRINKPYFIFLIWNILMIGAVRGLTFQHEPGRGVSGNGNLGLLVLFPSLLTFLILCIWTQLCPNGGYMISVSAGEERCMSVYP